MLPLSISNSATNTYRTRLMMIQKGMKMNGGALVSAAAFDRFILILKLKRCCEREIQIFVLGGGGNISRLCVSLVYERKLDFSSQGLLTASSTKVDCDGWRRLLHWFLRSRLRNLQQQINLENKCEQDLKNSCKSMSHQMFVAHTWVIGLLQV